MNLIFFLEIYLSLHLSFALGYLLLIFSYKAFNFFFSKFKKAQLLSMSYLLILTLPLISISLPSLYKPKVFEPFVKIWAPPPLANPSNFETRLFDLGFFNILSHKQNEVQSLHFEWSFIEWLALFLVMSILIYGSIKFLRELFLLKKLIQGAYRIKKLGRVSVCITDALLVPFSAKTFFSSYIVIPSFLVQNSNHFRIVCQHEAQHHRQRDTLWVYYLLLLDSFLIFNPFFKLWKRDISILQEFACDETLIGRKNVDSQDYARCLVEVAQQSLLRKVRPACATGFIYLSESKILMRRINFMFKEKNTKPRSQRYLNIFSAVILICIGITAVASRGLIQDRRVSVAQANEMLRQAQQSAEFPLVINEAVLKQLNHFVGTPGGRKHMQDSLARMENYRSMIEGKIVQYGHPMELIAIPIVESGYQNLAQSQHKGWGAGLWMFIESTARVYGLRVDESVDERMNTEILTDAAMRYLGSNNLRFKDWQLAVLAYNIGESRVQAAIEKTGSKNPWVIIEKGYQNDQNYLAKVIAAMLIYKNPEILN